MKNIIFSLFKCFVLTLFVHIFVFTNTWSLWANSKTTDTTISVEKGEVSLFSTDTINLGGIEVSNTDKTIDLVFSKPNYFGVEDLAGEGGYSTTMQISDIIKDDEKIESTNMQIKIKNGTIYTISGKEDTSSLSVPIGTRDFISFDTNRPATILQRSSTDSEIIGKYGVLPTLKFIIPAYQQIGNYSGNLTLVLSNQNNSSKIIPINLKILRASSFGDDNGDTTLVISGQKTESSSGNIVGDSDNITESINQVENTSTPIVVVDTKEDILNSVESLSGISLDSVKDYNGDIVLSKKAILFSDNQETKTPIIFIPLETGEKDKKIILSIPEGTRFSHSGVTIDPPRRINDFSNLESRIIQVSSSGGIRVESAISINTSQNISFDKLIDICMYNNGNSSVEGRKVYYSNNGTDWYEDINAVNLSIQDDKFCFQTNHLTDFAVVNTEPDDSGGSSGEGETTTDTTISVNAGVVTVFTPVSVDFGKIGVSSLEQTINIELDDPDYFGVEDLSGQGGYYTTLQIGELKDGSKVLKVNEAKIRVENGTIHTIAGQEDTSVSVSTGVRDFVLFDSENPATILERSITTSGKIGKYGVLPHMQLTIAKYQRAGNYEGIITFTIIEE